MMLAERRHMRLDWWAAPALLLAFAGLWLLYHGLYLSTPFGTVVADPRGHTWMVAGTGILLLAAAIVFARGRHILATLVAVSGIVTLALEILLPDAILGWIAFLVLAPVSVIACLAALIPARTPTAIA